MGLAARQQQRLALVLTFYLKEQHATHTHQDLRLDRVEDIQAVVAAVADAIGFVFYPKSHRYVTPQQAAGLIAAIPPYVTTVGLFVNATLEDVRAARAVAPLSLLQFHGDETPEHSAALAGAVQTPLRRCSASNPTPPLKIC